jgi:uncharacterized membrane protein (DUF4010 family)
MAPIIVATPPRVASGAVIAACSTFAVRGVRMELPTHLLPGLAAALGLGMLIGIERERRKDEEEPEAAAGVRTHALLALAGAVAGVLGPWALAVAGFGVVALTVASYVRTSSTGNAGLTAEIAILLTFLLGVLAMSQPLLAVSLGVAAAVLLASKQWLHRVTRELISEREMRDLLLLAASALIVLPLLPDQPIDPWDVLVPSSIGRLVVLVMAVGAAGHVALRLIGARWGLPLAGFFAGFASSTAATAGFGQRARDTPELRTAAAAAALFANLASLLLFAMVIGAGAPALLAAMRWPLLAAGVVLVAAAALGLWHAPRDAKSLPDEPQARAFRLSHALIFAAVVVGVLLLSAWLQRLFGDAGALVAATLAALAELHAAAASLAQLSSGGGMGIPHARWGMLALLAASVLSKSILAFVSGGVSYGLRVSAGLVAMLVAATAVLILVPAS